MAKTKATTSVVIEQPRAMQLVLEVTGTADLIQNNFPQKVLEQMLRKHMGLSVQREPKKPREVLKQAVVVNEEGRVCMLPVAFRKAMLSAAALLKEFKKTHLRQQIWINGKSIPITFEEQVPRMDMVRTSGIGRTPDIRFRPSFRGWKARIPIQFEGIAAQTVADLLNRAGRSGVGEWRRERDGDYGTFIVTRNVEDPAEIAEVEEQCSVPIPPLVIPEWALDEDITPEIVEKITAGAVKGAKIKKAR